MSKCLNCNKENPPSKANKERKYCSKECSNEYYKKTDRYRKRKDPWVRKYQLAEEELRQRREKHEKLLKTHMTAKQISQKLGIESSSVFGRAKVLGIVPLRHTYQSRRDYFSAEQVEKLANYKTSRAAIAPIGYIDRKELLSELQIHEITLCEWFRKFGKIPNTITAQGTSTPNKEFYNVQAIQRWMDDIEKYRQESADTNRAEKLAREKDIESKRLLMEREYKKKVKGLVSRKEISQLLGYKSFTPRMRQFLIEHEIVIAMPTFGKKKYYPVREVEKLKGILDAEKQERELKRRMRIKNRYPQLGQPQEELYEERIKRKIIKKHEMGLLRNQQEKYYYNFLEQVKEIESGIKIYKKCKDCKEEKEITEYYVDLTYANCRRHSCKECDLLKKSSSSNKCTRDEVLRVSNAFLNMIKKEMSKHTGSHFYMPQFEIWHELDKHCGYDKRAFIEHIESQFEPWMSWGNNGRLPAGKERKQTWQIDHVLPRVSFFYTKFSDEQFIKCWTLSNIRVVDSVDNSEKAILDQRRFGKTIT